jgi:hypothetical protein
MCVSARALRNRRKHRGKGVGAVPEFCERHHQRLNHGHMRAGQNMHLGRLSLLLNDIRPLFRPRDFGME